MGDKYLNDWMGVGGGMLGRDGNPRSNGDGASGASGYDLHADGGPLSHALRSGSGLFWPSPMQFGNNNSQNDGQTNHGPGSQPLGPRRTLPAYRRVPLAGQTLSPYTADKDGKSGASDTSDDEREDLEPLTLQGPKRSPVVPSAPPRTPPPGSFLTNPQSRRVSPQDLVDLAKACADKKSNYYNPQQALRLLGSAYEGCRRPSLLRMMGMVYRGMGRDDYAQRCFKQCYKGDPIAHKLYAALMMEEMQGMLPNLPLRSKEEVGVINNGLQVIGAFVIRCFNGCQDSISLNNAQEILGDQFYDVCLRLARSVVVHVQGVTCQRVLHANPNINSVLPSQTESGYPWANIQKLVTERLYSGAQLPTQYEILNVSRHLFPEVETVVAILKCRHVTLHPSAQGPHTEALLNSEIDSILFGTSPLVAR